MSRGTVATTGCTPEEDDDEIMLRGFHHNTCPYSRRSGHHFCVFSNMSTLLASRPNWSISPKTAQENAYF